MPTASPDETPPFPRTPGGIGPAGVGLVAGLGTAAAVLFVWLVMVVGWQQEAQEERQSIAEQTALRLEDWVGSRLLVLESIRAVRARGLVADPALWRTWVGLQLGTVDGFQAINWLDADGVIRVTAPAEGNEQALGRRVPEHPVAGPVFLASRERGVVLASPPLDLFQGGRAFTTYLPTRTADGSLLGFVNGVFRVDELIEHGLDHVDPDRWDVVLRDTEDGGLLWQASEVDEGGPRVGRARLQVADRSWSVVVVGASPTVSFTAHVLVTFGAVLLGLLAGGLSGWGRRQALQNAATRRESARIVRRLAEADRLESLGRMAGGIAHDFNNVLAVVIGRASELEARLGDSRPDLVEGVEGILDAGDRGADLVQMLLTFARRGEEVEGEVDAAAQLRGVGPMLRHLGGRRARVVVDVTPSAARVSLSAVAFDRLVMNLVTNAVEAVEDGGRVDVRLMLTDGNVLLDVTDDGAGMDEATRRRVFEPFFTTKVEGTGLGLATVFGIVRQGGGEVEVLSALGQGTTFRVRLPRAAAD